MLSVIATFVLKFRTQREHRLTNELRLSINIHAAKRMQTHILDASTLNQMQIAVCAIHSSGCVCVRVRALFFPDVLCKHTFLQYMLDSVCVCVGRICC